MYEGIKRAIGPKPPRFAPLKSRTGRSHHRSRGAVAALGWALSWTVCNSEHCHWYCHGCPSQIYQSWKSWTFHLPWKSSVKPLTVSLVGRPPGVTASRRKPWKMANRRCFSPCTNSFAYAGIRVTSPRICVMLTSSPVYKKQRRSQRFQQLSGHFPPQYCW